MVELKSEVRGTTHLTFYLQVLTGKPNGDKKKGCLLMAPGKFSVNLQNAKPFRIAKLENAF